MYNSNCGHCNYLGFYMPCEMKSAIRHYSKAAGVSMSDWVRYVLELHLEMLRLYEAKKP